jgi:DMSO/TMAO reductase YedYZ heme-binding membrane subunit
MTTITRDVRASQRIRRRHLIVTIAAVAVVATLYSLLGTTPETFVDNPGRKAANRTWLISTSLANAAVLFLCATLLVGPLRVLRGKKPIVHLPVRRTLGVAGATLGVAHIFFALNIHGSLPTAWEQFVTGRPTLDDPIVVLGGSRGLANYLGLLIGTSLLALAFVSRDTWVRRLGAGRWKIGQRATYLTLVLVALHALLYWRVERRLMLHRALVLAPIVVVAALQTSAAVVYTLRRRRLGAAADTP